MASREIFNKMYDASPNQKGDYFKRGSGRVVVLEAVQKDGADCGLFFSLRCKVLSAKPKDGVPCNNEGDRVGWPQLLDKFPKTAYPNVQGCVLAIVGCRKDEITKEQFTATFEDMINYVKGTKSEANGRSIDEVQAARGMLLDFDTYDQQTKVQKAETLASGGKVHNTNTYVKFFHVAEQGDIAARRAELDKTDPLQG